MTTRIPNTVTWRTRLDYDYEIEWGKAKAEYIRQFPVQIGLKFGPVYEQEFKDFNNWCESHLGTKFKDWFILSRGKGQYVLHSKDNKWATFLILSHVDKIVS